MTIITKKIADAKHANTQDAITLLKADHTLMSLVVPQYAEAKSATKKKTLVAQLCLELRIHMQIKEELFYPAISEVSPNKDLFAKAAREHVTLRKLITQLEQLEPNSETYDQEVKTLCDYAAQCFREEEKNIFTESEASKLNLLILGEQLLARKEQLHAEQEMLLL